MRVLAVDPGEKRLGIAISDPTGTISRPFAVVKHVSREKDAEKIAALAEEQGAEMIIIGQALDSDGQVGYRARKAIRLASVLQTKTDRQIRLWDESGTTQAAIQSRIRMGVSRKKRKGHLDDLAASILLQDFLIENEVEVKSKESGNGQE